MMLSPFARGPSFDEEARKDISKAVVIAGLSAIATKVVDIVGDEIKAWLQARRSKATAKDGAS